MRARAQKNDPNKDARACGAGLRVTRHCNELCDEDVVDSEEINRRKPTKETGWEKNDHSTGDGTARISKSLKGRDTAAAIILVTNRTPVLQRYPSSQHNWSKPSTRPQYRNKV